MAGIATIRTHCSGGELFGVGARQAGYTHIDGFEIEAKIAAVARLNGFAVRTADVCQVDYSALPDADHLHTSPSCKRASRANTNQGETSDDLAVADSVCRAIRAHAGRTFTLENVIEYRWFESFDRIVETLKQCGFLFRVVAKGGEKPSWRESTPLWNDCGEFVDAADFGVPQNRKRLILRAVRGVERLPGLRPTHSKRGGILLEKWNGWYSAIADIIDDLPDTTPAKWQLARMPQELRESILIGQGGYEGRIGMFSTNEPAPTITANRNHQQIRAYLLGDQRAGSSDGIQVRAGDEPALTVRSLGVSGGSAPRAYIVSAGSNGHHDSVPIRDSDEPVMTVLPNGIGRMRAYLLDGDNASRLSGEPTVRAVDEPAMSIRASRVSAHRAVVGGRWVRMTIHPLGRFQTVPDDYIGLTPQINGNGVPCLLARRIMESLRGVYADA
jgi:site-specific DNA-cytosine methylase